MPYSLGQAAAARRVAVAGGPVRRLYRHKILPRIYTTFDEGQGGILSDLSAEGAGIRAATVLDQDQSVHLRFSLPNPKCSVEVDAQVRWSNASGRAGLRFTGLEARLQRRLNEWILRDLLARIAQEGPVWQSSEEVTANPDLFEMPPSAIVPSSSRPAPMVSPLPRPQARSQPARQAWISSRSLVNLMDGLVLCCAVLLFFVVFLSVTHTLPSWPVAAAMIAGVAGIFALLYWGVFARIGGGTVGSRLARIGIEKRETKTISPPGDRSSVKGEEKL